MKKRMLSLIIMMVAMFSMVSPVFAKTLGEKDRYIVTSDGYGGFIIEDTVQKMCIVSIEVKKTEESGVYDFFCNGNSYRRIKSGMQLAGIIAGYFGAGVAGSLTGWAAGLIYDEVCAYYR